MLSKQDVRCWMRQYPYRAELLRVVGRLAAPALPGNLREI